MVYSLFVRPSGQFPEVNKLSNLNGSRNQTRHILIEIGSAYVLNDHMPKMFPIQATIINKGLEKLSYLEVQSTS